MYRFAGLHWDTADSHSGEHASFVGKRLCDPGGQWHAVLRAPGLIVLEAKSAEATEHAYVLPGEEGIVLGRLFERNMGDASPPGRTRIGRDVSEAILATRGRLLVERYWGGYVAILNDSNGRRVRVVRDCSGILPCFHIRAGRIDFIFSDIADASQFGLAPFTVNWPYVATFLHFDNVRIRSCGLNEVTEILPGDCLEISSSSTQASVLWDPMRISTTEIVDDYEVAVAQLEENTQRCIESWASTSKRLLLQLSGGFDSAVVLGCLRRGARRQQIVCLNRYTTDPDEDEREFARLVAKQADVELLEREWREGGMQLDERLVDLPVTAKPTLDVLGLADAMFRQELASGMGLDSVWTGQGGDHLFMQRRTNLIALDFMRHHPLSFGLVGVLRDAARLTEESYWSVMRSTLATLCSRGTWSPPSAIPSGSSFVKTDALPAHLGSYIVHPWFETAAGVPEGKQLQIRDLVDVVNQPSPFSRLETIPELHPLVSQPLIETCLRIPTYLLLRGGQTRALARQALKGRIPGEIYRRESKGSTRTFMTKTLRRYMPFIRELLLNGELAKAGLIDTRKLEYVVTSSAPLPGNLFPLLACLSAEIWSRGLLATHDQMRVNPGRLSA